MRARKIIQTIRRMSERYTKQNIFLLKFLLKNENDPEVYEMVVEDFWDFDLFQNFLNSEIPEHEHQEWMESAGYPLRPDGEVDMEAKGFDYGDVQNFKNLDKVEREYFAQWLINSLDWIFRPTQSLIKFVDKKLIKRDTWLVHFTHSPAYIIAEHGFKKGVSDPTKLGLTTWLGDEWKEMPGWNFAFRADGRHAERAARDGRYGEEGVLFQSSGVAGYHVGDEEQQIIFWGDDVDPRDMVVFDKRRGDYRVLPHPLAQHHTRRGRDEPVIEFERFEPMVDWVKKNVRQYSSIITGR